MDQIWTRINELAEANNGFVRTAQVEALGISRPMLRKYTDAGKLEQVRKGLYVLADGMPDEYALLQGQCRDAVFSYGTALYLWGLSDRTPHIYDITIPRDKNISVLKRDNPNIEKSIFNSIHNVNIDTMPGYKTDGDYHTFLEKFDACMDGEPEE